MGSTAKKVDRKYTYADYLAWPDNERWEILNGAARCMTPAPSTRHQRIARRIFSRLDRYLEGKGCEPFIAPTDVVLDEENVVQPDLLVVCDPAAVTEKNIQGAPALVVEILSPTTSILDRRDKKQLYERFGVREYILVDPLGDIVERHTLQDGRYGAADIYNWDERMTLAIFPELELPLWEIFGRELSEGKELPPEPA